MPNKYYNKATGTEIFNNIAVPVHLQYNPSNLDHIEIADTNPFFSALPEGMELNYSVGNVPTTLSPIPDYELSLIPI